MKRRGRVGISPARPPEEAVNCSIAKRAEVLAALARTLDVAQVAARFGLSLKELSQILQEAAEAIGAKEAAMWSLYCDGASRGNPGPAGAGYVLYDPDKVKRAAEGRFLGETTNNVAEYQALLLGLNKALELEVRDLKIFSDSELLVRQLKGQYRVRQPHLIPLWLEAGRKLQQFRHYAISHLDRSENREADLLARQAVDQYLQKR